MEQEMVYLFVSYESEDTFESIILELSLGEYTLHLRRGTLFMYLMKQIKDGNGSTVVRFNSISKL